MSDPTHLPSEAPRASRRAPVRGRRIGLRPRDVDVLGAIAKMRIVRTRDLARLFFGAVGTCQKRLRKLFDAGLVRSVVFENAAENRYVLTPLGHRLLEEALDGDVPRWRPAPRVDAPGLAHIDLLNRYRVALAVGAAREGLELVQFAADWDLRARDPHADIVPDAAVELRVGERHVGIAVEVDVGTETPGVVAKKFRAYDEARVARRRVGGLLAPAVILVVATPRRARSLARSVLASGSAHGGIGIPPFVLVDGGLRQGLTSFEALSASRGPIGPESFPAGLLGRS